MVVYSHKKGYEMFKIIRKMQDRKRWSAWFAIATKNGANEQEAAYVADTMVNLVKQSRKAK